MATTAKKQTAKKTAPEAPKGAVAVDQADDPKMAAATPADDASLLVYRKPAATSPAADAPLDVTDPQASTTSTPAMPPAADEVPAGVDSQASDDQAQPDATAGQQTATSADIDPAKHPNTAVQPDVDLPGYIANISVKYNGKVYKPGQPIVMDEDTAAPLLAALAIAPREPKKGK